MVAVAVAVAVGVAGAKGSRTVSTVGPPGGEDTRTSPSTARARSRSPVSPVPALGSAPPWPSSVTVASSTSRPCTTRVPTSTRAEVAPECLAMLVRASDTEK